METPASSKGAGAGARSSGPQDRFAMAATIVLALVLLESAIETFLHGSPLRWWVLVGVGSWAAAMVPGALYLKWGGRLWLTVVGVVGIIAFAAWHVPPAADPALTILTLPLSHVLPLLVVSALLLFASVAMRLRVVQRLPLLMTIIALLAIWGLLPFMFAAVYGTPLAAAARGIGVWTTPPLWLQGGFLALQGIVPFGVVLAVLAWLGAVAGRRQPGAALLPAIAGVVLAGAFAVGSLDLARAGMPNLMSRYAPEWLPAWVQPPDAGTAAAPALPGGVAAPGSAAPTSASPGARTAAGGPALGEQPSFAAEARADRLLEPLGRGATTKGVALTVESVEFTSDVGGRTAPPRQMFVIVRTTWQNLIALRANSPGGAAPVSYVVPSIHGQLWLLTDSRYADPIDEAATEALERHLPIGTLTVPAEGETVTGQVAFRTGANASFLALALLDAASGDALVSVKGRPIDAPPVPALGPPASNDTLTMTITEAGWSENAPAAPAGFRYFTVGVRTVGRFPGSLRMVDFTSTLRLVTDEGQEVEPQPAAWLKRPFATPAAVLPGLPNESQAAFLLAAETRSARVVLRSPSGGALELPVPFSFGSTPPGR
jgi:hypothetical protein